MKIEIKEKPWDLLFVAVVTALLIIAIALVPDSAMRTILGLPFILFFPGYVLISFLFPEEEPLDKIERIALSFGLSIAITPLIGLLLNYIWEISLVPILYSQSLFIFTFSLLAFLRRRTIPTEEMFSIEFEIDPPDWENYDIIDKALVIATVGLLIASGSLAYHIATTPRTGERFTEFGVLGPEGMADDYPTNLTVNETGTVIVMVTNREHASVNYTLVIGAGHSYDNMSDEGDIPEDFNVTLPSNNTYKETSVRLRHGEKWNRTVNFSIGEEGRAIKLNFFLLKDGDVYRQLHLWVDVLEG
ncbi:MAG: DUF1616 domain-containing protein [Candidatus Thermoplasmatota archaeon]|nr:DUF1616 domain-containing protein [Candidatus Thermoplasmatota archaeon]